MFNCCIHPFKNMIEMIRNIFETNEQYHNISKLTSVVIDNKGNVLDDWELASP